MRQKSDKSQILRLPPQAEGGRGGVVRRVSPWAARPARSFEGRFEVLPPQAEGGRGGDVR